MKQARWVRITGDGLAYSGPCDLTHIIFLPHAEVNYVELYDGRDATSGKKALRIKRATLTTGHIPLDPGLRFYLGIYVNARSRQDQTTVVFVPDLPTTPPGAVP